MAGAVAFAVAFGAGPAVADDSVDTAVDAIVSIGSIAGVPIDPTETTIIKAIVRCAINNTPVLNCARQEIILQLPLEARPLVGCVLAGTPIEQCGADEVLRQLPPEAQGVVRCIMAKTAIGKCGEGLLIDAAQKQAFDVIEKLKADGRSEVDAAGSGVIRNIIGLSEAIRVDDWLSVGFYGGTEVYKAAAKIVLKVLLPEVIPFGPVLDAAIDAIIQARADLVANVVHGVRTKDLHLIGEAITEAYLSEGVVVACSLPGIPDDVKEAICGDVGKIIHSLAETGGDVVDFVVRLIKDPLGIPDTLWDELQKLLGTITGKASDCVAPQQYYATHYARCYHRGVRQLASSAGQLDQLVGSLNYRCRRYYDRCFTSSHFDDLCNPQRAMFTTHVKQLDAAVDHAAIMYASSFRQYASSKGKAACNPQAFMRQEYEQFLDLCAGSLALQFPLPGDPERDECDSGPPGFLPPVAHRAACEKAMEGMDVSSALVAACYPEVKVQAPTGCHEQGAGRCGYLDIKCDAPLPPAVEFVLGGVTNLTVDRFVRDLGLVNAEYKGAGSGTARLCARNSTSNAACGESFTVTMGSPVDPSCFGPPPHQICPSGTRLCMSRCIGFHDSCNMIQ